MEISQLRESYTRGGIEKDDLAQAPIDQFQKWIEVAVSAGLPEPNAMTLATVGEGGIPSSRTVLLKGVDHGFCFYTNYRSQKSRDIETNPNVALTFLWHSLERQVIVQGVVEKTTRAESAAYFSTRPYDSQIGAWVSENQSAVIPDRAEIEARDIALKAQYPEGGVPLPEFWGGYRVIPTTVEFWQGRVGRLHDRIRYVRVNDAWELERLSP